MPLDTDLQDLATAGNFGALTTLFADGTPQTHVMWVDADEDHLLVNTEVHRAKFRNVERDSRVTLTIWNRDNPYQYAEVRGQVTGVVRGPDARAHIDACARRYTGEDYAHEVQSERAILQITPDRVFRKNL